jgi:predicted branched-subunit amino acid permease
MALQLIQGGAEPVQIIIATLIMNFRHFLMSSHLSTIFPIKEKPWLIPFLSFGVTDESFAYFSTSKHHRSADFILGLEYSAYASWVGGTIIGYLFGNILPPILQASMGIALYALFVALLIPEAKKSLSITLTAIIGGVTHSFLSWLGIFSSGWNIIMAILIAASVSTWITGEKEENE